MRNWQLFLIAVLLSWVSLGAVGFFDVEYNQGVDSQN